MQTIVSNANLYHHPVYEDNPDVLVLSIRHSGTRFLCDTVRCMHKHTDRIRGDDLEGLTIICPLRHPFEICQSWAHDEISEAFIKAWEDLGVFHQKYDILYIPIDVPAYRDIQLKALSDKIGKKIDVDWDNKIGHSPRNRAYRWFQEYDFIHDFEPVKIFYS